MFHKIFIIGHLGSDPEMRYTPGGTPVTNFSVAANRKWTDKEGNAKEEVTWFRISAWNRLAETCNQYLSKGRQVHIEGTLKPDDNGSPRVYERNDGTAAASYEVTAGRVTFLGGRGDSSEDNATTSPGVNSADEDPDKFPF